MNKFLFKAKYTPEGLKGLLKEGGTSRKATVEKLINELGGKLEAFYYAYGDVDVYLIADLPDSSTAAAISFTINSSGAVEISTIPLLAPEDIDKATKKTINYRSPGK